MRLETSILVGALLASVTPWALAAETTGKAALKVGLFGSATSMDAEVLRAFARTQGLEAQTLDVESVDQAVEQLQDGRLHVVAGLAVTDALKETAEFTSEVLPSRLVVLTRKPAAPITFLEGLRGMKIGLVAGSPATDALAAAKLPSWNLVPASSASSVLADLKAGRTAAVVLNVGEAVRAASGDGFLQSGVFIGPRQTMAYAVRKGNSALLGSLNAQLRQLRMSPSWSQLLARQTPGLLEALARARLEPSSSVN
jgi:polar amino acid transport system substrate-binding protein